MRRWFRLRWCRKQDATRALKRDNRGLSLVELIAAIAILGFLTVILSSFSRTGSMLYRRISGNLSLQVQSQIALAQLRENIVDANAGLYFSEETVGGAALNTLYVFGHENVYDPDSGTTNRLLFCRMFLFDGNTNMLYYKKQETSSVNLPSISAADAEMAGNITGFEVLMNAKDDPRLEKISELKITLSFALLSSAYTGELTVAPRNAPLGSVSVADADNLTELIEAIQ